jgi:hypothetical protein
MIYLVAGLDHSTFSRWHGHVRATDATVAARTAMNRAARQGVDLVVAAVIGPYGNVEPVLAELPRSVRPEAA